jgi:hypothetical protein
MGTEPQIQRDLMVHTIWLKPFVTLKSERHSTLRYRASPGFISCYIYPYILASNTPTGAPPPPQTPGVGGVGVFEARIYGYMDIFGIDPY